MKYLVLIVSIIMLLGAFIVEMGAFAYTLDNQSGHASDITNFVSVSALCLVVGTIGCTGAIITGNKISDQHS